MNWENYGVYKKSEKTWQISHIIPQSSFNFSFIGDPEFLKCWALENLRPLEANENMKKGAKILAAEEKN